MSWNCRRQLAGLPAGSTSQGPEVQPLGRLDGAGRRTVFALHGACREHALTDAASSPAVAVLDSEGSLVSWNQELLAPQPR